MSGHCAHVAALFLILCIVVHVLSTMYWGEGAMYIYTYMYIVHGATSRLVLFSQCELVRGYQHYIFIPRLDSGCTVKVSDGALAQQLYPECYYTLFGAIRPVRWAAVETLQEGLCTVRSNVVSGLWSQSRLIVRGQNMILSSGPSTNLVVFDKSVHTYSIYILSKQEWPHWLWLTSPICIPTCSHVSKWSVK